MEGLDLDPRMLTRPRELRPVNTLEAMKAARPKKRKAVAACASRQRLDMFAEPLVILLLLR